MSSITDYIEPINDISVDIKKMLNKYDKLLMNTTEQMEKINKHCAYIKSMKFDLCYISQQLKYIEKLAVDLKNHVISDDSYIIILEIENYTEGADTCNIIIKYTETKLLNEFISGNIPKKNKQIYFKIVDSSVVKRFEDSHGMACYLIMHHCRNYINNVWTINTDNIEDMLTYVDAKIDRINNPIDNIMEEINELYEYVGENLMEINELYEYVTVRPGEL